MSGFCHICKEYVSVFHDEEECEKNILADLNKNYKSMRVDDLK